MSEGEVLTKALELIVKEYGAWVFIILYICVKHIMPFFSDKLWPEYIKERQAIRDDSRFREDRLCNLLSATNEILAGLRTTLDDSITRLSEISRMLFDIAEDIAGLYGHNIRPSTKRRGTKQ